MALLFTILVLGLLASFSPSTLVVFILLLATKRASTNGAAFLVGWSLSLIVVFVGSYLLGGTHTASHGSGHAVLNVVEILLGLGLVALGVREWRRRGRPMKPSPREQQLEGRLEDLGPMEAVMVGVWEQPWTLTAAVAVLIANHHEALLVAVLSFVVFTVVSTATVGAIYLYFARRPGEAQAHLEALRQRLVALGPTLFAAVSFAVGLYLVGDGTLSLLTS
jgi:hypothetical protein